MSNLPISVNSAPVKTTPGKQATSPDTVQAESAEFGNVLARQVAEPDKAATPPASQPGRDTNKKASSQGNAEPSLPAEDARTLPAEMLAALAAQQSPSIAPQEIPGKQTEAANQTDAVVQPELMQSVAMPPIAANIPGMTYQNALAPLSAQEGNRVSGSMQQATLASSLPEYTGSLPDGKGFSNSAKTTGIKELGATNSAPSVRPGVLTESPLTAQQVSILPMLQGTTPTSSPVVINTPLTQPAWGEEFSQKITWMAGQRNQSAELHLNPPHLGPLDVVLKMNGDQASAIFTSPHAAVRDAIEQALPQLREMLADSGIMLGNASVYDQTTNKNQGNAARKPSSAKSESEPEITTNTSVPIATHSRHNGLVDTFA